jgi:hypothetical protein
MISTVWYEIPNSCSPENVATVKGLRKAYTQVYAKKVRAAILRAVKTCLVLFFVNVMDSSDGDQ